MIRPCSQCGRPAADTHACSPEERAAFLEELAKTREEFVRLWPRAKASLHLLKSPEREEVIENLRHALESDGPMACQVEHAEDPAFAACMEELRAVARELCGTRDPKTAS